MDQFLIHRIAKDRGDINSNFLNLIKKWKDSIDVDCLINYIEFFDLSLKEKAIMGLVLDR